MIATDGRKDSKDVDSTHRSSIHGYRAELDAGNNEENKEDTKRSSV